MIEHVAWKCQLPHKVFVHPTSTEVHIVIVPSLEESTEQCAVEQVFVTCVYDIPNMENVRIDHIMILEQCILILFRDFSWFDVIQLLLWLVFEGFLVLERSMHVDKPDTHGNGALVLQNDLVPVLVIEAQACLEVFGKAFKRFGVNFKLHILSLSLLVLNTSD